MSIFKRLVSEYSSSENVTVGIEILQNFQEMLLAHKECGERKYGAPVCFTKGIDSRL